MNSPEFWANQDRARTVSQRAEHINAALTQWDTLVHDVQGIRELAVDSSDEALTAELEQEYTRIEKQFNQLEFYILLSEPHDDHRAIITIHAGAGGTEAQDWAAMLLRMFLRYAEGRGWSARIVDESRGQETGFKSVSLHVDAAYAYGYFKSEAGVHRLVRISPFDAEKMRHTSFALVEVLPELDDNEAVTIKESDLRVDVFRSGGSGGQSVNTTDSAVRITHIPTGLVVKCQNERSQMQNKKMAMAMLQAKLLRLQRTARGRELSEIRGEALSAEWGNQIRSYVLQPYKLVKDHRTDMESTDPDAVLEGELDGFIESYLRYLKQTHT